VSDILKISPFSEEILNLTSVQMLWIIKNDMASKGVVDESESFIDEDYEAKERAALGEP